jgi:hypothetical protein
MTLHIRVVETVVGVTLLMGAYVLITDHWSNNPITVEPTQVEMPCSVVAVLPVLAPPVPEPIVEVPVVDPAWVEPLVSEFVPLPVPRKADGSKKKFVPAVAKKIKVAPSASTMNCEDVRWYAAHFNKTVLEGMAKARGVSDADVAAAKKCF